MVASSCDFTASLLVRASVWKVSSAAFSVGFSASVDACATSSRWRRVSSAANIRWLDSRFAVTDWRTWSLTLTLTVTNTMTSSTRTVTKVTASVLTTRRGGRLP